MRKTLILLMLFLMVPTFALAGNMPGIYGQSGVAIDATTGQILYDKKAKERGYPASLTKVMTAILLEEYVKDGEVLVAGDNAVAQECSCFGVRMNMKMEKEDALKALMVTSANDVAMMIAEHIGETPEGFAEMMNKKAKEIGAKDTNFVTPNGLHDENHYSTPYDIALITKEAMKYPEIVEVMGTKTTTVKAYFEEEIDGGKEYIEKEVTLTNPSKIHDNPIAIGGKTGYTSIAQNTLVEILQKDGKRIIAVVFKSSLTAEYTDIESMGEYAFEQLKTEKIVEEKEIVGQTMVGKEEINLLAEEDVIISYKKNKKEDIEKRIVIENELEFVEENQKVASLQIWSGEKKIKEIKLLSDKTVEKQTVSSFQMTKIIQGILVPIVLLLLYRIYIRTKEKKERNKNFVISKGIKKD